MSVKVHVRNGVSSCFTRALFMYDGDVQVRLLYNGTVAYMNGMYAIVFYL